MSDKVPTHTTLISGKLINFVLTSDHEEAVSALQSRVAELEAALRECVYAVISGSDIVPPSARQALSPKDSP